MSSNARILRSGASVKPSLNVDNPSASTKPKPPRKRKDAKVSNSTANINPNSKDSEDAGTDVKLSKLEVPNTTRKRSASPRKKKSEIDNMQNKMEIKTEAAATDLKQSKLEVPITVRKKSASPRKKKSEIDNTQNKMEIKTEAADTVSDIENGGWEPNCWREVWENILEMRKLYIAPVDSLGCEECPEKDVAPEIFRYQALISVMLSSQTRDEVTHAATQRLIEHGLTVDNVLNTPDEKIGELIYPAGFWKTKVKYIKKTSQILKEQYNGDIPRTFKELCKLPGVGPKMAHIVMSVGWKDTVGIAVDTHVHRISNRLGWVKKPTKTPEETRKALESWLPKDLWSPVNVTLVGFGQTVCRPVGPLCEICFNKNICPTGRKSPSKKK